MALISCPECSMQISDKAKSCPSCGCPLVEPENNTNTGSEMILYEGLANRIKNVLYVENGHGAITNQRFIYSHHAIAKTLAIGAFVNVTKGSVALSIPLSTIENVAKGKRGLNSVLIIETKSGESFRFAVFKYPEWEQALVSAIGSL